jgi:hypothetical protein
MTELTVTYNRTLFALIKGFCIFFGVIGWIFSISALVDLTFKLGWGWGWQSLPAGPVASAAAFVFWRFARVLRALIDKL